MADEVTIFPVKFDGGRYDIKKFLRDHPGGMGTLKNFKGKNILEVMEKYEHSNSAYHMLNDFKMRKEELRDGNLTGSVSEKGRIITREEITRNKEEIAFMEELESRLDWSKPILDQLHLIAPHYDTWMNTAVYRTCRLFGNPALELLTYTPWYVVPIFWIPIILYLLYSEYFKHVACDLYPDERISIVGYIYHVAFGVLLWTSLEYILHRWLFHLDPGNSPYLIKFHFLIHGLHHKTPFDIYRQVFPPLPATVLAIFLYLPLQFVFTHIVLKTAGGLIGYLAYDMIHVYVHHGSPKDGSYLYQMKRYHSNHHFINHDKAFGISTMMWDYVFLTFVEVKKLGFSLYW